MGVHSLWDVIGPTGRPVQLESLSGKRIAIDASIWLYQFLKGLRDNEGNSLKNSHIIGFFRRICKLLYFGIKPVFVFDGDAPILKKETIKQRQEKRQSKKDDAANTAKKLLALQFQKNANSKARTTALEIQKVTSIFSAPDEYNLPNISGFTYDKDDSRIMSNQEYKNSLEPMNDLDGINLDSINPTSKEFDQLPKSIQYLILSTLRLKSRLRMGFTKEQLESFFKNDMEFSKFQIEMVKKRNFFTQKLMNTTNMHDNTALESSVEVTNRIAGQKNKEYKLVKIETGWALGLQNDDRLNNNKSACVDNIPLNHIDLHSNTSQYSDGSDDLVEWEDVDLSSFPKSKELDCSLDLSKLRNSMDETQLSGSKSFVDKRLDTISSNNFTVSNNPLYELNYSENSTENYKKQVIETETADNTNELGFDVKQYGIKVQSKLDKLNFNAPITNVTYNIDQSNLHAHNISEKHQIKNDIKQRDESTKLNLSDKIPKLDVFQNSILFDNLNQESLNTNFPPKKKKISTPQIPCWFDSSTINEYPHSYESSLFSTKITKNLEYLGDDKQLDSLIKPVCEKSLEDKILSMESNNNLELINEKSNNFQTCTNKRTLEINPLDEEAMTYEQMKKHRKYFDVKRDLNPNACKMAFHETELSKRLAKERRDADELSVTMIHEIQELLSNFGIPYIIAPMETEAQCAKLLSLNLIDGIITDDSDVFLFGGTNIYKNMFQEKKYVEFYSSTAIADTLGLDRQKMIDFAHLVGSDYTNGIKGIGLVSGLEILAEFDDLDDFREWYNEGQFNTKKLADENPIRKRLRKQLVSNGVILDSDFPSNLVTHAYWNPKVDNSEIPFVWGIPDLDGLRIFLKNNVGWDQKKSDEILVPLIQMLNTRKRSVTQRYINDFFPSSYIKANKNLKLGQRVEEAVKKLQKRHLKNHN